MPQSLSAVYLHLVFSTVDRRPFLVDPDVRAKMHAYLAGITRRLDCPALLIGGVSDHVHILVRHGRTISQADLIKETKRASSIWVKDQGPGLSNFGWQSGYGVFSVDAADLDAIRTYIENQEAHHRVVTFKDEFLELLRLHNLEWDERYVWD